MHHCPGTERHPAHTLEYLPGGRSEPQELGCEREGSASDALKEQGATTLQMR